MGGGADTPIGVGGGVGRAAATGSGGDGSLRPPPDEPVPAGQGACTAAAGRAELPLVSCLCVTEGRVQFWPWLWWNFIKQDHPRRELVIVDSSPEPIAVDDPRVRVVTATPGTSVAVK